MRPKILAILSRTGNGQKNCAYLAMDRDITVLGSTGVAGTRPSGWFVDGGGIIRQQRGTSRFEVESKFTEQRSPSLAT
eukprot:945628-Rhodomonas_salina.1